MKVFVQSKIEYNNTKYIKFVNTKSEADVCVYIDSDAEGSAKEIHFSTMPTQNQKYISSPNNKTVVILPKIPQDLTKSISDIATKIDNPNLEKFKYCIHEEEVKSINHFTHSYAVMCECLVFYKGCSNLETILPEKSFVRYTSSDDLMRKLEDCVKEDWWNDHILEIRKAKKIILEKYHLPAYLNRIVHHEIVLKNTFSYRFDFFAKVAYGMFPLSTYYRNLYRNHISIFNQGYELDDGRFEALGTKQVKKSVGEFVSSFNTLIQSFKEHGFDSRYPIPLGSNNLIENGVHRLALSYVHRILPEYNLLPNPSSGHNYIVFQPMINEYYNSILLRACKEREDLNLITIFPVANKKFDLDTVNYLNNNGMIYCANMFNLTEKGMFNYIKECYRGEDWASDEGIQFKADKCSGKYKVRICLYFSNRPLQEIKDNLREIYKIRDSVHIHDNHEQKLRLAKILFHKNSFIFMNNVIPKLTPKNQLQLEKFARLTHQKDSYAIDSSFIMSLYNLREANDLDYVSYGVKEIRDGDIDCHNSHFAIYEKTPIKTLLEDEANYFYYRGIKVLNLSFVQNMKNKRLEGKDYKDLELIKSLNNNAKGVFIVLEGPDCSGKTTHSKLIAKYIKSELKQPCELIRFPNRNTSIGKLLDSFLKKQENFSEETLALLFAANQREMQENIKHLLNNGIHVICDRYYISGIVYREKCDLEWMENLNKGLIQPDITLLFHPLFEVNDNKEIYHTKEKQKLVWERFQKYSSNTIQVYPSTLEKRDADLKLFLKKLLN